MRAASLSMIAAGLALTVVNILGHAAGPGAGGEHHGRSGESIPGYSYPIRSTARLQEMLREPLADFDLETVNDTVFESIVHSDRRKIRVRENWLLWLAGKAYEPLSRTQDPGRIVSGGEGLCSEVSAVLNAIAGINGLETRFVGLNGHVVSEIRTDSGWRVTDPDYGITYPGGIESLEKAEGIPLMRRMLKERGYDDDIIDVYVRLFQSSEDNTVTETGVALSPRLYAAEMIAEWLKWIIPAMLAALGFIGSGKRRA